MNQIVENYRKIVRELPPEVKIVVVSKTRTTDEIMQLYHEGVRIFGENRVQELIPKYQALPRDISWNMIGHMQTNKVKYIAPFIAMIHSVDSLKLLQEINSQAKKYERIIDCLLQFHIATEETKFGLDLSEAGGILDSDEFPLLLNVRIRGIMGMATFSDNLDLVRSEFRVLKNIFDTLKRNYFSNEESFSVISMGMTSDYPLAVEEGSNMVRIGGAIFGAR